MRYHYDLNGNIVFPYTSQNNPAPKNIIDWHVESFRDHPVFIGYVYYESGNIGLGIVEQGYLIDSRSTFWGVPRSNIHYPLLDAIYRHNKFPEIFNKWAGPKDEYGAYPTVPIRKLMWALRMKPLPKERWETTFDRRFI